MWRILFFHTKVASNMKNEQRSVSPMRRREFLRGMVAVAVAASAVLSLPGDTGSQPRNGDPYQLAAAERFRKALSQVDFSGMGTLCRSMEEARGRPS